MNRPRVKGLLATLVLTLCWSEAWPAAPDEAACLRDKFERYATAQIRWQRDLTALVAAVHPGLADVAALYRDDQLVRIALRRRMVAQWIAGSLEPPDPTLPLSRWGLFDPAQEARLAAREPQIAELLTRREAARARPPHPDGDALRAAMRAGIAQRDDYLALVARLQHALDEADEMRCDRAP